MEIVKAVAIYIRLSSEDRDARSGGKAESESIANQRSMLLAYIQKQPEFAGATIREFCDDGWSGKSFDRPAVRRMLEGVRGGAIQCIVVKDISRFGRDYLTVGNYLTRVFPFLGVRFVAINDHFDSNRAADVNSLDTSFRTLIYDLYSRDLSRKVSSAKKNRAERGAFLSPYAPFGYQKDPRDRNRLLIDEEAARVVRRIYQGYLAGKPMVKIAQELNDECIPTPMLHKRKHGCTRTRWRSVKEENFWDESAVSIILRDECYTGKVIYGKKTRKAVGMNRSLSAPRAAWIVIPAMHAAIIEEDMFQKTQRQLRRKEQKKRAGKEKHPLLGKVFCGVCKHALLRVARKRPYFLCETHRYFTQCHCPQEKIEEAELADAALKLIRVQARYAVEAERVALEVRQKRRDDVAALKKELAHIGVLKSRLEDRGKNLYEAYVEGQLAQEEYLRRKQALRCQMGEAAAAIADMQTRLAANGPINGPPAASMQKYIDADILTVGMALELVERIEIYPDMKLELTLNFAEEWLFTE